MRHLRATARLVLCISWAFTVVVIGRVIRAFHVIAPHRSERWRSVVYRRGCGVMARLLGIRTECVGPIPQAPYLLVCNHVSIFDIFVLGAITGGRFIARADLATWPAFGAVVREFGTIFINRENARDAVRVNREIRAGLEAGGGLIVFPEAGIADEGDVRKFRNACFQPVVELGLPVHYAAIGFDTPQDGPTADEAIVWRDPDTIWGHFRKVAGLAWSRAFVVFGEEPVVGNDRRVLAEAAHAAVWTSFQPLRQVQTREEPVPES